MILRVGLLYLWSLIVAPGCSANNANNTSTTICYKESKGNDQYCYVECTTIKSKPSSSSINPITYNNFKNYSGYAAVAAKLRFYKHQRDHKIKHDSKFDDVSQLERFICVVIAFVVIVFFVCFAALMDCNGPDRRYVERLGS